MIAAQDRAIWIRIRRRSLRGWRVRHSFSEGGDGRRRSKGLECQKHERGL